MRLLIALLMLAAPAAAERPAIEYFPASARPDGTSRPFSESVRVGDILYLSGQIGARRDGPCPTVSRRRLGR